MGAWEKEIDMRKLGAEELSGAEHVCKNQVTSRRSRQGNCQHMEIMEELVCGPYPPSSCVQPLSQPLMNSFVSVARTMLTWLSPHFLRHFHYSWTWVSGPGFSANKTDQTSVFVGLASCMDGASDRWFHRHTDWPYSIKDCCHANK